MFVKPYFVYHFLFLQLEKASFHLSFSALRMLKKPYIIHHFLFSGFGVEGSATGSRLVLRAETFGDFEIRLGTLI